VRTAKHAPHDPGRLLVHRHALAEIVERGAFVHVERRRVKHPRRGGRRRAGAEMNIADGALLNETAWSALVGMSKKHARDAAKAELSAE
jgi:hypothetical protein